MHNIDMDKKRELEQRNPFSTSDKIKRVTSPYRLYGFDSNILEDRAYLKMDNEMLSLEYQINELEEDLMIINDEIIAAINLDDTQRATYFKQKKVRFEKKLELLNEKYYDLGALSKVAGLISAIFKKKPRHTKSISAKIGYFISKYILPLFSKRLKFTFNLKESLEKLANINRSVDELISMQTSYGDVNVRYDKLTQYISKANDIHSQISKNLNNFSDEKKIKGIGQLLDVTQ